MVKYKQSYIARFDEKVQCDRCGKQMRLGQCICGFDGNVCSDCARKEDAQRKRKKNRCPNCGADMRGEEHEND